MDNFSICTDWKIWAFFPPSKHNLNLLQNAGRSTGKLHRHFEELQDGSCAVLGPWQALYVPTGYLHATYSLKGGMTIGTTWSSAEALLSTTEGLVVELYPDAQVPVTCRSDVIYFIRCLVQAFNLRQYAACKSAMDQVCWKKLGILGKEGALFGPGWGLGRGPGNGEINSSLADIEAAIAASQCSAEFWSCDSCGVASVLEHIWTKDDMAKMKKKKR
jgi:hypothetical protein